MLAVVPELALAFMGEVDDAAAVWWVCEELEVADEAPGDDGELVAEAVEAPAVEEAEVAAAALRGVGADDCLRSWCFWACWCWNCCCFWCCGMGGRTGLCCACC